MLYRDRRNEIHRKQAKKKALKTLAKKRQRKLVAIKKRKTTSQPIHEIEENKIIIDEDGEVTITEPDNVQVEYKPIVPCYKEQVIQLPPEDTHMTDPRTKNLVLKRKHPKDEAVNIKKYIEGTDISTRNVWDVALPMPAPESKPADVGATAAAAPGGDNSGDGGGEEEWDIKPFAYQRRLATVTYIQ